ncbi:predicted protein [Nematostella vectensis]|uniref:Uncharacterized protein n=1 Tax=Nematostella vectensis TaxID=45351 RepID=A7SA07_NEMVE|nr:uncharacterized protein LOC5511130 [Nematostella vectensis]EDO39514.1 predicted protein [Nematostella vectensis]|eukprot:XP_001631577.1 predicted protein [Nematostella vectensis]
MAFLIDNLSSDQWKRVDCHTDPEKDGYREYLVCHRLPTSDEKVEFKYSASEERNDSRPVELMLYGARGRDPLQGIQRPYLKVEDNQIIGMEVCGECCERK